MWWEIYRRWTLWSFERRIRKHGWTATYVGESEGEPPFSYSIGFWETAKAPEVIMFGFDQSATNAILHEVYRQLLSGRLEFADGAAWDMGWGDEGPALRWRKVHRSQIRRDYFNIAIWYRERRGLSRWDIEAYQLFTTDRAGKFPWEEGFDLSYRPEQKQLYLPYVGPPDED
jgi:hypothetical protein